MPRIIVPTDPIGTPQEINAVPLFTRSGSPRHRFTFEDKLRILGCSEEQLQAFADLFVPRRTHFAIRRATADDLGHWIEGRGFLYLEDIARHLIGARLPGVRPLWIAPRAWDWTRFVAVDVDNRGDLQDFQERCKLVETAIERMGVTRQFWLVMPTPSGGRHYYFFTDHRVRTAEIPDVLAMVGIRTTRGRFEVFPSTSFGLRLPFGHLPGHFHDPEAWIKFISHPLESVSWERCKCHAIDYANQRQRRTDPEAQRPARNIDQMQIHRQTMHVKKQCAASAIGDPTLQRYRSLLSQPINSPSEIEELWQLGIREDGTRHQAMSRIAWNLVFVKGLPEKKAVNRLASWAYRTGAQTSKTVSLDLEHGTQTVEQDARDLVCHYLSLGKRVGAVAPAVFNRQELTAIRSRISDRSRSYRRSYACFLLQFLKFAKGYGASRSDGWECSIAAAGVMRTWKRCSGCRYKRYLDWALQDGIIHKTREKNQTDDRTGQPRTFVMYVPVASQEDNEFSLETALEHLVDAMAGNQPDSVKQGDTHNKSDKYLVGLRPKAEDHPHGDIASDPFGQRVNQELKRNQVTLSPTTPRPSPDRPDIIPETRNLNYECSPPDPGGAAGERDSDPEQRDLRGEHPRRPPCRLATGTPERPLVGHPLQGLRDPAARTEPAHATANEFAHTGVTPRSKPAFQSSRLRPTTEELDALPPPHDHVAISTLIEQLKQQAIAEFPSHGQRIANHWSGIERLACQSGLHSYNRWLLLTEPAALTDAQLQARHHLLLPARRHGMGRRIKTHHHADRPWLSANGAQHVGHVAGTFSNPPVIRIKPE